MSAVGELLERWGVIQKPAPEARETPMPAAPEYPTTFEEIVGQADLVTLLRAEVAAARREGRPLRHMLLYGPPGTGKSQHFHAVRRLTPFGSLRLAVKVEDGRARQTSFENVPAFSVATEVTVDVAGLAGSA